MDLDDVARIVLDLALHKADTKRFGDEPFRPGPWSAYARRG